MIATELAVVNATETLFYLTWLLKNVTGDGLREAIRSCGKDYSAAAEGLGETLMDVAGRSYEQAYFRTQPREAAGKCRKVFGDSGLEYPPALAGRGEMLEKLCDLVHDLIYWYLVDL
ncbi:uncharacterized protein [Aristolochia californica]|uniref:uncharacterized protein n=1 Tax=Aristolochia californica TaxID=171875 RepID=UPI0035D9E8BA